MNITVPKRVISTTLALLAGVFLFSSIFGSMHTFAMEMGQGAPVNECALLGMGKDCAGMNPLEHITLWQSSFGTTGLNISTGTVLVALFMMLTLAIVIPRTLRLFIVSLRLVKQKLYRHTHGLVFILPLQEALSQGILNPKTY